MKLGNLLIQQTHQGQSADVLMIALPMKTALLPLRLVRRTASFLGDVAYWLLVNVFAGNEGGYVALHKR
jgi:hypothetical protein